MSKISFKSNVNFGRKSRKNTDNSRKSILKNKQKKTEELVSNA